MAIPKRREFMTLHNGLPVSTTRAAGTGSTEIHLFSYFMDGEVKRYISGTVNLEGARSLAKQLLWTVEQAEGEIKARGGQ